MPALASKPLAVFLAALTGLGAVLAEPLLECQQRSGLPNVFTKLATSNTVRIAYLGGSITAQEGWRPKTLKWFRDQFPTAKVEEINAAIGGTGSDPSPGCTRLCGEPPRVDETTRHQFPFPRHEHCHRGHLICRAMTPGFD